MFRPTPLYIGLRYLRAKRRNHFISFISLASMLGIALGITVLITVLSVMNGFDQHIRERVFSMAQQVTISSYTGSLPDWQRVRQEVESMPDVVAAAPFVRGQGMLANGGQVHPVILNGVLPDEQAKLSQLSEAIVVGRLDALTAGDFGIILGQTLAYNLAVGVGDKVTVVLPEATVTPLAVVPRFKRFTVVGIFKVGSGFGYDSTLAFTHLNDAQKLFNLGESVTGVAVKLTDLYQAPYFSQLLRVKLPPSDTVSSWTQDFGAFFQAIQLEKTMIFFILLLIIAIAAFNLVSTLVMVVSDKESDIAILRTFGATPKTIMSIFMVQGTAIGLIGTLLGLIGGIALALNVTEVVAVIERLFHVQFISSSVYYVNFLPSKLEWDDVWRVCVAAIGMSFLATLYPAWRASRTQPAEALRYE